MRSSGGIRTMGFHVKSTKPFKVSYVLANGTKVTKGAKIPYNPYKIDPSTGTFTKIFWWPLDFITAFLDAPYFAWTMPGYIYNWCVDLFGPGKGFESVYNSWFQWRVVDVLFFGIPDSLMFFVRTDKPGPNFNQQLMSIWAITCTSLAWLTMLGLSTFVIFVDIALAITIVVPFWQYYWAYQPWKDNIPIYNWITGLGY